MTPGLERATPRDRRRAANQRRILDAALDVVVERGFDGLSLELVGEATDYTRPALYRYFPSKAALISALSVLVIEQISDHVASRLERAPESFVGAIVLALTAYREFARDEPAKFALLSMLLADRNVLLPREEDAIPALLALHGALAPLEALLAQAAAAGDLEDGDERARAAVLFASVHGVLQLRKQSDRSVTLPSTDELCAVAVRGLLTGWGADPKSLPNRLPREPS